ncbi:hypothetical protein Y032_0264g632 [Ancylostoma ceylanicum]|uniref:Uncharacterized protein n=1 Tax=Ancylostoma ceylanicum TaxID=53326 RepID=A0A016S9Q7_9BILA|nr:hypothetical protein Y032_0264g632 [Ancylostoma ceylanicum]
MLISDFASHDAFRRRSVSGHAPPETRMDKVNHSGLSLHPERLTFSIQATVNMTEEINKDDESGSESRPAPKVFQLTADELEKLM